MEQVKSSEHNIGVEEFEREKVSNKDKEKEE